MRFQFQKYEKISKTTTSKILHKLSTGSYKQYKSFHKHELWLLTKTHTQTSKKLNSVKNWISILKRLKKIYSKDIGSYPPKGDAYHIDGGFNCFDFCFNIWVRRGIWHFQNPNTTVTFFCPWKCFGWDGMGRNTKSVL